MEANEQNNAQQKESAKTEINGKRELLKNTIEQFMSESVDENGLLGLHLQQDFRDELNLDTALSLHELVQKSAELYEAQVYIFKAIASINENQKMIADRLTKIGNEIERYNNYTIVKPYRKHE